jgi:hypothetical protein
MGEIYKVIIILNNDLMGDKRMKKKIIRIFVVIMLISPMLLAYTTESDQKVNNIDSLNKINVEYTFDKPVLQTIKIGEKNFNRIISSGLDPAGKPGEPLVPSKGAYILLPPDSEIDSIKITYNPGKFIRTEYLIEPMEHSKTIEDLQNIIYPEPDIKIYTKDDFYPSELFTKSGIYQFRGYTILVLLLHPIQYNPVDGKIQYYEKFTVSVETKSSGSIPDFFRGSKIDEEQLKQKVDNLYDVRFYKDVQQKTTHNPDTYDLLIITDEQLKDYFQPLKEDHDLRGILTEIKTLTDIGGTNSPEDIRDFIKQEYYSNGIEYVLLGGDADIIPAKMIFVEGMDEETWYCSYTMPVDMYYGCLDENGPTNDGGDLMAEVYVGRACVGDPEEVKIFTNKSILYMNMKRGVDSYLDNILLVGEYLGGDFGIATFSGNELDQLIDNCSDDGYSTIGFSTSEYNIEKIYDRDWPGFDKNNSYETGWQPENIINRINLGEHIVPHSGHSWYSSYMKMHYNWIVEGYYKNANKPFFAYSTGCMAGGFDDPGGYDCIAEYFTAKSVEGAFAGIWNARSGFFWTFRLDSDSHRYNREFFDAIFGEKIYNIAKANQDSKEDNLHLINRSCMRIVYFETNLFGDPSISFHISYPPDKPETPTGMTRGNVEEKYNFTTSSIEPDNEKIYYKWDWGDGRYSDWLGPYNSGEICEASYSWKDKGEYNVCVISQDIYGEQSEWSDPITVTMPKLFNIFNHWITRLIQRFPVFEKILNQII